MVKKILRAFGGEIKSVHEAAYLLGFFALLAQILAMFRDRLLAHYFGASQTLDVYYAAFRIPDFIFVTVASLVAGSVLIPFLQEKIVEGNEVAKKMIDEVWSAFFALLFAVSFVVFFLMPYLVKYLFGGMDDSSLAMITLLSRILLLSPMFLGFSNFLSSIIQAHRRFALYALSPVLYNLGIIFGIIFLFPKFGIVGVVLGVVLGSIFHAFIQMPFARSIGMFPRAVYPVALDRLRSISVVSLPRTLTLASTNIIIVALVSMASRMTEGSISIFNFANNFQTGPLSIIGASYSMAAFPTLSKLFAEGQKEKFVKYVSSALRHIIFWSLPASVVFIVVRAQIVRTVLGSGAFSWNDTRLTAACVALFAISVVAQSANLLFIRAYYASGKTRVPLVVSFVSAIVTIALSALLYKMFYVFPFLKTFVETTFKVQGISGTEVLALPLGYSLGTLFNMGYFIYVFERDFKNLLSSIRSTFAQGVFASIIGGVFAYLTLLIVGNMITLNTLTGVFSQGLLAGLLGLFVWFMILRALKNKEADELLQNVKGRIWKAEAIAPEQMDI